MANCERPKYVTCEFVKGHRRLNKVNTTKKNTMKDQYLKKDHILHGHMVSADHYISLDPGRLYYKKGNHINMICNQEDVSLFTMPVVM